VCAAAHRERARGRSNYTRHELEERALAGAIAADERNLFASPDLEVHAVERNVLLRTVVEPSRPKRSSSF